MKTPASAYARGARGKWKGVWQEWYRLEWQCGLRANWGCGDFTRSARKAAETSGARGRGVFALNPLHAIPNCQPYNTSPYLPLCSFYRNHLYLDVERVPGFLPEDAPQREIVALRAAELVEYELVSDIKLRALRRAFERFEKSGDTGGFEDRFRAVRGRSPARFCASSARPDEQIHLRKSRDLAVEGLAGRYRNLRSSSVAICRRASRPQVRVKVFLQWQVDRQLAEAQAHAIAQGMKIGSGLPTWRWPPTGSGRTLWMNRLFYANGACVGAPPR